MNTGLVTSGQRSRRGRYQLLPPSPACRWIKTVDVLILWRWAVNFKRLWVVKDRRLRRNCIKVSLGTTPEWPVTSIERRNPQRGDFGNTCLGAVTLLVCRTGGRDRVGILAVRKGGEDCSHGENAIEKELRPLRRDFTSACTRRQ